MSDSSPESYKNFTRKCLLLFVAAACCTGLMVGTYLAPLAGNLRIGLILAIACVNALLAATFLMHVITERKMVHALLAFTVIFVVALMALSLFARSDIPHLKAF